MPVIHSQTRVTVTYNIEFNKYSLALIEKEPPITKIVHKMYINKHYCGPRMHLLTHTHDILLKHAFCSVNDLV